MNDAAPVLAVDGLRVELEKHHTSIPIVEDVSFDVRAGETVALVGESGSGKSITALSAIGLLPQAAKVTNGTILLHGRDLLSLRPKALRRVRGSDIGMVFQDPLTSLNPTQSVGAHFDEAIGLHQTDTSKQARRELATDLLETVGVPDAEGMLSTFPHQLSGGMRQRVVIATAIANDPAVLIADEPTTALDVTIQAQVLDVLNTARRTTGAAMLLITHDLGVVAENTQRILCMYAGRIVETGPTDDVLASPRHPYTLALLRSQPQVGHRDLDLRPIPGSPPSVDARPTGCRFHPRCNLANGREVCATRSPELVSVAEGRSAACHFADEMIDR